MRLAALGGVVMESMTRGQAWRFLDMGRRLERAMNLVVMLRAALSRQSDREAPLLESVLDVADSGMTYRRRYLANLQVVPVVDLLVTDDTNPRSVVFQLEALADHFPHLPHDMTRDEARGGRATAGRDRGRRGRADARRRSAAPVRAGRARAAPGADGAAGRDRARSAGAVRRAERPVPEPRDGVAAAGGGAAVVIYRVVHVTDYGYADAVPTSHHLLHLAPRDTERQICRHDELSISPEPASRVERVDHFGNRATYFEVQEPHRQLTVESRRDVELLALPPPPSSGGPEWETVRDLVRQPRDTEMLEACEMTYRVAVRAHLRGGGRFAAPSFPPGRPLLDALADLTHRIIPGLVYDPAATVVSTPVARCCACAAASARTSPIWRSPACARWACRRATSAATW